MTELSTGDDKDFISDTASASQLADIKIARPAKFSNNEEVLSRWNDGLLYIGHVLQVDYDNENCLLRFDDSSEYWTKFKDIHRIKGPSHDSDIICCLCLSGESELPNEIVICDNCGVGYHQDCHTPSIPHSTLLPDVEWNCRLCVFGNTAKIGGALNKGQFAKEMQTMKQTLPYDIKLLTWDAQHKTNREQTYCYCGGPGDWCFKMLQCYVCKQWFHEACIQCLGKPLLFGDRFYVFMCAVCGGGAEFIQRLELKWVDLIHLVLFNISLQDGRKYFDIEDCIVGFVQKNWEMLQLQGVVANTRPSERVAIVKSTLEGNHGRFKCGKEIRKRASIWGLRSKVPPPAPRVNFTIPDLFTEKLKKNLKLHGAFMSLSSYASSSRKIRQGSKFMAQAVVFGNNQNGNCPRQFKLPLPEDATSESEGLFNKLRQRLKDVLKHSKARCALVLPQLTEDKKMTPKRPKKNEIEAVEQKLGKLPKLPVADKSVNQAKPRRKYVRRSPSSSASSNKMFKNCDILKDVEDAPIRGNLDSIIPPPPDFLGRSNPFYDMTLDCQNSSRPRKRHLSQEAAHLVNTAEGRRKRPCSNRVGNSVTNCVPIPVEKPEAKTNRRLGSNIGPSRVDMSNSDVSRSSSFRRKFSYANGSSVREVKDSPVAGANGCYKQVRRGSSISVMKLLGTRVNPGGKVQYLIEWI